MTTIIECPSGLRGVIRGWKVREANLFFDKAVQRSNLLIDKILGAVWEETIDPGPYAPATNGKVPWEEVLLGDRMFAIVMSRHHTYLDLKGEPEPYAFTVKCTNELCGRSIAWEFMLSDLPVKRLSDESRAAFVAGNRFTTDALGRPVIFKLRTGRDDRDLAERLVSDATTRAVTSLATRIIEVPGVATKPKEIRTWVSDLEMQDMLKLLRAFDEHDCGVETSFDVECQRCGTTQEVELPLGKEFFLPNTRKKASSSAQSDS